MDLPIFEVRERLHAVMRQVGVAIVQAPTGSGKSTQIPQWLLDDVASDNAGEVVVLQPRRLAARMLAGRVAFERGENLGETVGYQVRFESKRSARTRLLFVTEGILLRRMVEDPDLNKVGTVVFDEFHERHLYGDLSLALACELRKRRPDLRIVVMSATLETERLESYFRASLGLEQSVVVRGEGRSYPVDLRYLARSPGEREPIWMSAISALEGLASDCEGDALIFMPGAFEIERTLAEIRASSVLKGWKAFALHGELAPERQDEAVRKIAGCRKVVVATNVAETSLTIDGIQIVIDSGLARIGRYDPHRGIDTLLVEKISRAASDQRAGRAGRTAPGVCLRLWTAREQEARPPHETPEIHRIDLAESALTLKAAGFHDLQMFPWFEAPRAAVLERSEWLLRRLGATRASGSISDLGRRMLRFPVHPRHARLLIEGGERGCLKEACLIAALTQGRGIWSRQEGRLHGDGRDDLFGEATESDWQHAMRAFEYAEKRNFQPEQCRQAGVHAQAARQIARLKVQFEQIAGRMEFDDKGAAEADDQEHQIWKALLAAFPDFVAVRLDEGTLRCALVGERSGTLARESRMRNSPLLVAGEIREIQQRGNELNVLLCEATAIQESWLRELFPESVSEKSTVRYDVTKRQVVKFTRVCFEDLPLGKATFCTPHPDEAAPVLAEAIREHALVLKGWDDAAEQWIGRVNFVAGRFPELGVEAIHDEARGVLLEAFCHGALGYKDVKEKSAMPTLKGWLSVGLNAEVERLAPERLSLPGGRKAKVDYRGALAPSIEARIQDLFDVKGGLSIGGGRIPLTVQILAPNHRPVQVTSDLSDFWTKIYPEIKPGLQRRYPRHEWR